MSRTYGALIVQIGEFRVTHLDYEKHGLDHRLQDLLKQSHASRLQVVCSCQTPARKLVIRNRSGKYFLAAWPDDARNHEFSCRFHQGVRSDAKELHVEALTVEPDGCFRLRPDFDLVVKRNEPSPRPESRAPNSLSTPTLPLLATMQFLWERARLNCWSASWTRDYWRVHAALCAAAGQGEIHMGPPLSEVMFVPRPFRISQLEQIRQDWTQFFAGMLGQDDGLRQRRLILGEVKSIDRGEIGLTFSIRHLAHPVYMRMELYRRLYRQFSRPLSSVGRELEYPSRVMMLSVVEIDETGKHLMAVDAALMLCGAVWIPASTGFEVALANLLVDQNRGFEKPMQLLGDRSLLPDFVLEDTAMPTALEVLGVASSKYLERKDEKLQLLRRQGMDVWVWNAAAGDPMPMLPSVARRRL